jgi:hypothetical protein
MQGTRSIGLQLSEMMQRNTNLIFLILSAHNGREKLSGRNFIVSCNQEYPAWHIQPTSL